MNKNKCTLLIDGNWLLQSRVAVMMNEFNINNSDQTKEQAMDDLQELMARSINVILNRFKIIDNIIMISDGGSWRKQLPIPDVLKNIIYKGNRSQDSEFDWNCIYHTLNKFTHHLKKLGITTVSSPDIEGDDWIWYWSRKLNEDGINCIIWSSDNDLKQLVQYNSHNSTTIWYNDRNGLFMPDELAPKTDAMDFFLTPPIYQPVLESIKSSSPKKDYVNPNDIILNKIICGDSGDNIKPVIWYENTTKSGVRRYNITEKIWNEIRNQLNINTIQDLLNHETTVAKYICNHKRFKKYNKNIQDIVNMIIYNIKLVWLNENIIPEPIIMTMNQQEYKIYDVPYIRSNFRILFEDKNEETIKNLFENI